MSTHPLISVIVPVFNGERYLAECIDSVLNQSYDNIELIIVNDGSTDSSADIIAGYCRCDSRVVLINQSNQGPSVARNAALDLAKGELITFVDADDVVDVDYIQVLYALLTETSCDISACGFTTDQAKMRLANDGFVTIDSIGYITDVLYQRFSDNSIWGKLFKKSIWDNVRFKSMRYEDLEIYPRLCLKASTITVTPAKLYYYRVNPQSFINTFSNERTDVLAAVDCIDKHIRDNATMCHDNLVKALKSRKISASFNVLLVTEGKTEYSAINSMAWNNIRELRMACLRDSNVRFKIKLGILCSFAGKSTLRRLNNMFSISS